MNREVLFLWEPRITTNEKVYFLALNPGGQSYRTENDDV